MHLKFTSFFTSILLLLPALAQAQLPKAMTQAEALQMPDYRINHPVSRFSKTTPPAQPVRTMAEWEEIDGLMVAWTSYYDVLTEIVRHARLETTVYIVTDDSTAAQTTLAGAGVPSGNIQYVYAPINSVWARDYGQWNAYTDEVDSLLLIDWIYNRPRPKDDTVPSALARMLQLPLHEMTLPPNDLIHTGGNYMVDGFGTAFSSKLILDENSTKTSDEIDTIAKKFMGIERYIKMNTLPYDGIHHIDMHIKLLDEETLLVGQFPAGISDGPQLEANLLYVLSSYNSVYGTPYKIVRIPMPSSTANDYPPTAYYRTFTNSVIVNKTVLVPLYREEFDTTALRIYRQAMPGYKIVGINVESMIGASGAIHCITKEVGSSTPLLIKHQPLRDTNINSSRTVAAYIRHKAGIASATLHYRTDTLQPYQTIAMSALSGNEWQVSIPGYPAGTHVYYYIEAQSTSGKTQVRPMPAPAGYWSYLINGTNNIDNVASTKQLISVFPNPSNGITCIPVYSESSQKASIQVLDITGKMIANVYEGSISRGESLHFFNSTFWADGMYLVRLITGNDAVTKKLMVRH